MTYVRGSARGARAGGASLGIVGLALTGVGVWGASNWWSILPFFALFAYWIVRPWFLGVWIQYEQVKVVSWFRTRVFREGEVVSVDVVPYHGLIGVSPISWLPLIGSIRMLQIATVDGRELPLPVTGSRQNRVVRMARVVRTNLGLKAG